MKKLRLGLPILAFVLAIAASAFTTSQQAQKPKAVLTDSWFEYQGPVPQTNNRILDENNYVRVTAPEGCESDQNICAILVPGTGDHPDAFSSTLEADLLSAFQNKEPQSDYIEMKQ